jgi:hypothetical protein
VHTSTPTDASARRSCLPQRQVEFVQPHVEVAVKVVETDEAALPTNEEGHLKRPRLARGSGERGSCIFLRTLSRRFQEAGLVGDRDGLGATVDSELGEYALDMGAHRLRADDKLARDVRRALTLRKPSEHLELSVGQVEVPWSLETR